VLTDIVQKFPAIERLPFWIFSESYGGKMAANFGVALDAAIKNGQINLKHFMGVALGDSWIAPVDCMYSYPPYMTATSLIDENQARNLTTYAVWADQAWAAGEGVDATNYWGEQQYFAETYAGGVNFYNFLYYDDYLPENLLATLVESTYRQKFGIIPDNVTWGGQSEDVFSYMEGDFMRPGVLAVNKLLNLGYTVAVYSGQLDIIVDVICIESWMKELTWDGLPNFLTAQRNIVTINSVPNGYLKSYKNLQLWGIYKAGHMVPADNGDMALVMFNSITSATKQ